MAEPESPGERGRALAEPLSPPRHPEPTALYTSLTSPVMVWVTDPDGACTFLSESWYDFTGQTPATGLGFGWLGAVHPDDQELAGQTFLAANRAQRPFQLDYRLRRKDDRRFLEEAQRGAREWRQLLHDAVERPGAPMKPGRIARDLGARLAPDALVAWDSGHNTGLLARYCDARDGQRYAGSGLLASMGSALPYAIAAQLAYPGRQVIAFAGDGGMAMLLCELATVVRYRLPIKIVVVRNDSLGQIKWEQMVFLGNPEYGVELQPIDFVQFAHACGGVGFRCETPDQVRPAIEAAFAAKGPALVEAVVDPFEPPQPPSATFTQGLHMAEALARGEPHRGRIALTLFRDKISDFS